MAPEIARFYGARASHAALAVASNSPTRFLQNCFLHYAWRLKLVVALTLRHP